MTSDLDWRPYNSLGTRSRVMQIITRGSVELELCGEGGQWVIRRTERKGKRVTVTETSRGRPRDVEDVWNQLASE